MLPDAVTAVRAAGDAVMGLYRRRIDVVDKDSGRPAGEGEVVKNPVTEADLLADRILREALPALLPGSAWLSEETADSPERLDAELVWVVDPIDGTREYVEGVDEFAISVALVERGNPVLAVLFNPAQGVLFTAIRGGGAFRDGVRVRCAMRAPDARPVLLASRTESRRGEFDIFRAQFDIRDVGSTAWKLALIAGGEGHAYFTRKPRNEWDIAAGVLLAREAGAAVLDLGRSPHTFNRPDPLCRGVVACSAPLADPIFGLIEQVGTLE